MGANKDFNEYTFSLSVAGLGVVVQCRDAGLAAGLRVSYQDFPLGDTVHLSLEVRLTGRERSSPLLDTGTVFRGGLLNFTAPGYQGVLDVVAGTGALELSSAHPLEDLDYAIRVAYALLAFQSGGVMLHAAGIMRQGSAYLFTGHSGCGKTTVSHLSSQAVVLNDDLVILLPMNDTWQVYGTPFWNPSQVAPHPHNAPLAGLYRLLQAERVGIEAVRDSLAIADLVANVPVIPEDPGRIVELMARLAAIHRKVPLKKLHFTLDDTFWDLVAPQCA